jgi:hypothetical protein
MILLTRPQRSVWGDLLKVVAENADALKAYVAWHNPTLVKVIDLIVRNSLM